MHIVILCATRRGYRFAEYLFNIGQGHQFTVFSFRETPWEPPYLDALEQLVRRHGHHFIEARNVAHQKYSAFWNDNSLDLMLMVSWRYLLPASIYCRASSGAYVFHDSLLPKYRGFAPTVWAMINGESETGVTLFKITEEVDAGDIVDQQVVSIGSTDTIAEVSERVTKTYLDMIESNFITLLSGDPQLRAQDQRDATYTCKWTPDDGLINWCLPSRSIYDLVRALGSPYPGAFTFLDGRKLTVWSAELPASPRQYVASVPGRVVEIKSAIGSVVMTGNGSLLLKDVQLEGRDIVNASGILNSPSKTLGGGKS